jgi:hypothetical protein
VSHLGDDIGEMPNQRLLDDASVEAVLDGRLVPSELSALAGAVGALRDTEWRPVRPSRELAEFMAAGGFHAKHRPHAARWHAASSRLARMSLRVKLAAGFAAGLSGLTGAAAAAGELPNVVQASVETAVEFVTPIDVVQPTIETAVELVTPIEFHDERVSFKGTADRAQKIDDLESGPAIPGGQLPYAVSVSVPAQIATPTPTESPTPAPSPSATEPGVVLTPTPTSTPSPLPIESPPPEPEPTPTETPTPSPTPEPPPESPPPDPIPPGDAAAAAGSDAPPTEQIAAGDAADPTASEPLATGPDLASNPE